MEPLAPANLTRRIRFPDFRYSTATLLALGPQVRPRKRRPRGQAARNVARIIKTTAPGPTRFRPLTAVEARHFLDAARADRLHALYELALRAGLRSPLERPRPHRRNGQHLAPAPAHPNRRTHASAHQGPSVRAPHRPPDRMPPLPQGTQGAAGQGARDRRARLERRKPRLHHNHRTASRPGQPHPPFPQLPRPGRTPSHPLPRPSTRDCDLLLEQGVDLIVIKELLRHAHIGVTASVYAHVRLRLQRDAIDALSTALDGSAGHDPTRDDGNDPPLCGAPSPADVAVNYCHHPMQKPRQDTPDRASCLLPHPFKGKAGKL
ncbi:hypothetical protein SUDANB66_04011 [Streptomyces sp. SudanB66_2053]